MSNCLVKLSPEVHARVTAYATAVNISFDSAADKIINRWMDDTGDLVIEELAKKRRKAQPTSVVPFGADPAREASASV